MAVPEYDIQTGDVVQVGDVQIRITWSIQTGDVVDSS
jgi:predicted RecA/RadA family phage recombinase